MPQLHTSNVKMSQLSSTKLATPRARSRSPRSPPKVLADVTVVYAGVVQTCTTSSRVVESFELVLPRGMP
ncbi:hypothetical protein Taro_046254 [Colocasia esculenta]|uniref:Uncharacterized protein n=1 Tax=Colocasia esculenta TaxID=4460 RepID=A0A843X788_COLES|nr:hypothetical protein [Colocasia esculenta]